MDQEGCGDAGERGSSAMSIIVKERPILFSGPMVCAILEGRKTQTRRIMKPQPSCYVGTVLATNLNSDNLKPASYFDSYCSERKSKENPRGKGIHWCWWSPDDRQGPDWIRCPYGIPGQRLWVRESFALHPTMQECGHHAVFYRAHDTILPENKWSASMFMPRWASRILLEITDVRVERLRDISEDDAIAEGCGKLPPFMDEGGSHTATEMRYRSGFRDTWESINGPDSWNINPFVWVISFRRIGQDATSKASAPMAGVAA